MYDSRPNYQFKELVVKVLKHFLVRIIKVTIRYSLIFPLRCCFREKKSKIARYLKSHTRLKIFTIDVEEKQTFHASIGAVNKFL